MFQAADGGRAARACAGLGRHHEQLSPPLAATHDRPACNIDDVHRSVLDELIDKYELGVLSEADRAAIASAWALDVATTVVILRPYGNDC